MRYKIIIESEDGNECFGSFCPDVPGCIATGHTREETIANMRSALEFHLEGEELPEPSYDAPEGFLPNDGESVCEVVCVDVDPFAKVT